jgi:hypothetical protein
MYGGLILVASASVLAGPSMAAKASPAPAEVMRAGPSTAANPAVTPDSAEKVREACDIIVVDANSEGFDCADLWAEPDGNNGGYEVFGGNEVYCQSRTSPVHIVACKSIIETPATGWEIDVMQTPRQICGMAPHSACGALDNFHFGPTLNFDPGAGVPGAPVFTCTAWGESLNVSIALPGSGDAGFGAIISTTHDNFPC